MKTIRDFLPEFAGAEKVEQFFEGVPSFHDSEVISIHLDRELGADFRGPSARIEFHVFDAAQAPDSALRRNAKLTLLFEMIEIEDLRGFNAQNAMSEIRVAEYFCDRLQEKRLRFEFGENGFAFRFTTTHVRVVDLQPFAPVDWFAV